MGGVSSLPLMAVIRHYDSQESIHISRNNFRFRLRCDVLAVDQLIQEQEEDEIPRDDGRVNVQARQMILDH